MLAAMAFVGLITVSVTPEQFCIGECPGPGQYWDEVFDRMFMSETCAPQPKSLIYPDNEHRKGCSIELNSQEYLFSKPLEIPRPNYIRGQGMPNGEVCASTLSFARDIPGIIIPGWGGTSRETIGQNSSYPGKHIGQGAKLERLCISSKGGTNPLAHGARISGHVVMQDVFISRFPGDGLRIDTPEGGNPSLSSFHRVSVFLVGRRGIAVEAGSNNSQMVFSEINVVRPCQQAGDNACSGVYEAGKLGNLYLSPHVNGYGTIAYQADTTASAHSLFIQAYEEDSSVHSRIKFGSILFGTINNDLSLGALTLGATGFRGKVVFNNDDGGRTILGRTFPNGLLEFRSTQGDVWRFIDDPYNQALRLSHGGVSPASFFLTGRNSLLGPNRLWVPSLYIGLKAQDAILFNGLPQN